MEVNNKTPALANYREHSSTYTTVTIILCVVCAFFAALYSANILCQARAQLATLEARVKYLQTQVEVLKDEDRATQDYTGVCIVPLLCFLYFLGFIGIVCAFLFVTRKVLQTLLSHISNDRCQPKSTTKSN